MQIIQPCHFFSCQYQRQKKATRLSGIEISFIIPRSSFTESSRCFPKTEQLHTEEAEPQKDDVMTTMGGRPRPDQVRVLTTAEFDFSILWIKVGKVNKA